MSTIAKGVAKVFQRLEEDPNNPIFWTTYEVQTAYIEAMNEAALVTGVVQEVQTNTLTLPAGTNYIPMPQNAIAIIRLVGQFPVQKTDLYALDQMIPGWENFGGVSANPPVQTIAYWFPLGLDQFGIFPQLSVPQQVKITYLAYPFQESPADYTGQEPVPFQKEFHDGLQDYAAHVCRLKEAGQEFQASQVLYQNFLNTMRDLTVFQARHDNLIFSTAAGANVRVVPVAVRG